MHPVPQLLYRGMCVGSSLLFQSHGRSCVRNNHLPHHPLAHSSYRVTLTSFAVIKTGHTAPANCSPLVDPDFPTPSSSPPPLLLRRSRVSGTAAQDPPRLPFPAQRSTGIPKNVPGPSTRLLLRRVQWFCCRGRGGEGGVIVKGGGVSCCSLMVVVAALCRDTKASCRLHSGREILRAG